MSSVRARADSPLNQPNLYTSKFDTILWASIGRQNDFKIIILEIQFTMGKFLTTCSLIFLLISSSFAQNRDNFSKEELGSVVNIVCHIGQDNQDDTLDFFQFTDLEQKQLCNCTKKNVINNVSKKEIVKFLKRLEIVIEMAENEMISVNDESLEPIMDRYFGDGSEGSWLDHFYFNAKQTCQDDIVKKKYGS